MGAKLFTWPGQHIPLTQEAIKFFHPVKAVLWALRSSILYGLQNFLSCPGAKPPSLLQTRHVINHDVRLFQFAPELTTYKLSAAVLEDVEIP